MELCHHGIKGQKWGVRRYQNPDGTLTEAGRRRYSSTAKEYLKALDEYREIVKRSATNEYSAVERKPIDYEEVKARSGLTNETDIRNSILLAEKKFEEASKIEPKITSDVVDVVKNNGCTMYGLEFRLKQPTSMAGKIGEKIKEGEPSKAASNGIKDSIRYTAILDDSNFVSQFSSISNELTNRGYKVSDTKNYYKKYQEGKVSHKAVQSNYVDKNGNIFEIQFHTVSSQAAKELKIPLYEESRKSGVSQERLILLEKRMKTLADMVRDPDDIFNI